MNSKAIPGVEHNVSLCRPQQTYFADVVVYEVDFSQILISSDSIQRPSEAIVERRGVWNTTTLVYKKKKRSTERWKFEKQKRRERKKMKRDMRSMHASHKNEPEVSQRLCNAQTFATYSWTLVHKKNSRPSVQFCWVEHQRHFRTTKHFFCQRICHSFQFTPSSLFCKWRELDGNLLLCAESPVLLHNWYMHKQKDTFLISEMSSYIKAND